MSEEIIKVLNNLGEKFGITIDWASQNVMPYIQDLMSRYNHYYIISSIVWLAIEIILLIVEIAIFISCIKEKKINKYWDWFDEGATRLMVLCGGAIILGIAIPVTIHILLEGIFFPELVFIQAIQ